MPVELRPVGAGERLVSHPQGCALGYRIGLRWGWGTLGLASLVIQRRNGNSSSTCISGTSSATPTLMEDDSYCIARLRHFASLVPMAQAARKPMFDLRQAGGIGGGQLLSVKRCRKEFQRLVAGVTQRLDQTVEASGLTVATVEQPI